MRLHDDLLEQANHLAKLDKTRPKQANLRRAVSSSYYALFHLLTSEASALYTENRELIARINRTFNHADMKKVSLYIGNSKLPRSLIDSGCVIPVELKTVANAFVALQQDRHEADYNLSLTLSRRRALDVIESAREAFDAWKQVKKTDAARIYLACFHLWKRWDDEPR